MKQAELLKKKIDRFLKRERLLKNQEYAKLEKPFLTKARKNFMVANLMFNISEQEQLKKALALSHDFETYDWAIVASYYSMYTSALATIAKLGFKSKSHAATLAVLEHFYVSENKLEQKHLHRLSNAYTLSEAFITKLLESKTRRETAQYDATPAISRENASSALKDADEFITKIEEILS